MKYIPGIIAGGSGSVGGCVFSRNRFGSYIRNRSIPVNPGTIEQQAIRNALGLLSANWKVLTDVQRDNWTNYALNTPYTDWQGAPITLTGLQMYCAINVPRLQVGLGGLNNAPTTFGLAVVSGLGLTTLVAATEVLTFIFSNSDTWATAVGGALLVYISRPQSPTTLFFKGPYQFAGRVNGAVVPPTSPATVTSPFDYAVGGRSHVQFRAVQADGKISPVQRYSILAS